MFWLNHFLTSFVPVALVLLNTDLRQDEKLISTENNPSSMALRFSSRSWESKLPKVLRLESDAADELQRQIDQLTKTMKDLQSQSTSGASSSQLSETQKQIRDLSQELQTLYRNVDNLNRDQQQEFKTKVDSLQLQLSLLILQLSDRMAQVENTQQKSILETMIGQIQDGQTNTAARSLKLVGNPLAKIPSVVNEAFESNLAMCKNIFEFINRINLDKIEPGLTNKAKAEGFRTINYLLNNHMFTEAGSECIFRLGWEATQFRRHLNSQTEAEAATDIANIISSLPKAVQLIVDGFYIRIRRDRSEECRKGNWEIKTDYNTDLDYVDDRIKWRAESKDGGGHLIFRDFKRIVYLRERALGGDGKNVFMVAPYAEEEAGEDRSKFEWQPILAGNEKVLLKHRASGHFLANDPVKWNCNPYVLVSPGGEVAWLITEEDP